MAVKECFVQFLLWSTVVLIPCKAERFLLILKVVLCIVSTDMLCKQVCRFMCDR